MKAQFISHITYICRNSGLFFVCFYPLLPESALKLVF